MAPGYIYLQYMLSIIIPYHNEGVKFIMETLDSLISTIDISDYEIIIIDDHSDEKLLLDNYESVKVIRHDVHRGVGAAFDSGVKLAKYPRLFLMGSDIRFLNNQWASKIVKSIDDNQKSLIAVTCVGINKDNMDPSKGKHLRRNGATILMFHDHKNDSKKDKTFRNIIEAKWLPVDNSRTEAYEIPCILGASYGVSKEWYEYIDGFAGHKTWGTLEPYISLKSWLFGGNCILEPNIATAHIFKAKGTHSIPPCHMIYNKLLVASLLFDEKDRDRLIDFLGMNKYVFIARNLYTKNSEFIERKRKEYQSKIVFSVREFCKKFNIDFRDKK